MGQSNDSSGNYIPDVKILLEVLPEKLISNLKPPWS